MTSSSSPAAERRRPGFARFDSPRILQAIDAALASPGGMKIDALAERLGVDPTTIWRYLRGLAERNAPIEGFLGEPFRYSRAFNLFTADGRKVLG